MPAESRLSPWRLAALLLLTTLPVLLTTALMAVLGSTPGARAIRQSLGTAAFSIGVYALANWATFGLVLAVAGWPRLRAHGLRFRVNRRRLGAALVGFVAGVGIYLAVDWVLRQFQVPRMRGMDYAEPAVPALLVLAFSAVLTAAFCEEVFFRVIWVGALRTRIPVWLAGALSILVFAAIHYPYFGPGGSLFIVFWAIVPTVLFVRFGDLTASFLMHLLNNAFAYLIVPSVF